MRAFNDLKLVAKLALPAGLVLLVALGLVGLARSGLDAMGRTMGEIVDVRTSRAVAALRVENAVAQAAIAQRSVIIEGSDEVRQALARQHRTAEDLAGAQAERLVALAGSAEERAQDEALRTGVADYLAFSAKVVTNAQQGMTDVALHPTRASSYNNVLVDASGAVARSSICARNGPLLSGPGGRRTTATCERRTSTQ